MSFSALNVGRFSTLFFVNLATLFIKVCLRPCIAPRLYSFVRWSTWMMGIVADLAYTKSDGRECYEMLQWLDDIGEISFRSFEIQVAQGQQCECDKQSRQHGIEIRGSTSKHDVLKRVDLAG